MDVDGLIWCDVKMFYSGVFEIRNVDKVFVVLND